MDADQVVLEFAAQIDEVFFPFEVGEQLVEEKELGAPCRDRQPQAGQIMDLAEKTGKGGLAALVRAGDHQDALRPGEPEIVGHRHDARWQQPAGQGQVDGFVRIHLLGRGDLRQTEGQTGLGHGRGVLQPGKVHLDFPVEPGHARIEKIRVGCPKPGQGRKKLGKQLRHQVEDAGLHMVHFRHVLKGEAIGAGRAFLKPGEGGLDLDAVVRLALVRETLHLQAFDLEAVAERGKLAQQALRLIPEGGEAG